MVHLFVTNFCGQTFIVEAEYANTIKQLKQKVFEKTNADIKAQKLFTNLGKELLDNLTLRDYNILEGSTIRLHIRYNCAPHGELPVKHWNGSVVKIPVWLNTPVHELIEQFHKKHAADKDINDISLFYNNSMVSPAKTLNFKNYDFKDVKNIRIEAFYSPIHRMISDMNFKGMESYITKGEVESISPAGDTPLHVACRMRLTKFAKALVEAGANPLHKDKSGASCVDVARKVKSSKLELCLVEGICKIREKERNSLRDENKTLQVISNMYQRKVTELENKISKMSHEFEQKLKERSKPAIIEDRKLVERLSFDELREQEKLLSKFAEQIAAVRNRIGERIAEQNMCTICYTHNKSHAIVPCGHTFCARCAHHPSLRTCGICRGPKNNVLELHL